MSSEKTINVNSDVSIDITNTNSDNPLGYERISKLLYKFSIPSIIGMTINALYNVVDRIFIGNSPDLGTNGLAAITICFPAMIIILSVGILLGQGGATFFAISLGKGEDEKARHILGNTLSMTIIFSAIISLIGILFLDKLLVLFGASNTIMPYADQYMKIILIGAIFQVVGMGLNNLMRSDGKPKLAMATMFIGAGINVILDPLLIYGLHMGMRGAAIATITSQFISMIWCISIFTKKSAKYRIEKKYMKINLELCKKILTLGMPGFILQLVNSSLALLLNSSILKYGGDIAVSGMGIINTIQTLLLLPVIGLNQGLQPIVSFNYGAKKYTRVKKAVLLTIIVAVIISTIGFFISRFVPHLLVAMFNRDEHLMTFTVSAIQKWFLLIPLSGFQIVASNFFQAIGKPKKALMLTMTRQVIVLMPSIIILSRMIGMNGILYSAPIADFVSSVVTAFFFFTFIKNTLSSKEEIKIQ